MAYIDAPEAGIVDCMRCGWKFVSVDPERLRRCTDCRAIEDGYMPPTGKVIMSEAVATFLRDTEDHR